MNKWAEISIPVNREAIEAVSHYLTEMGTGGVVIEGELVKAYLAVDGSLKERLAEINRFLKELPRFDPAWEAGQLTLNELDEEDWANAWKAYYKPVRLTNKITIVPTWEKYTPSVEERVINLDPGMAFGTGTHPTTRLAAEALEKYLRPGDEVIDVGCGSGILSIIAAKLDAEKVLALDIDRLAVKITRENLLLNHVLPKVSVHQNDLLHGISQPADLIVANILAEVILRFIDQAQQLLRTGGYFISSGIILRKQKEVEQALVSHGFSIVETVNMGDWVAIIAQKV